MEKGKFIVFEGIGSAGKGTQINYADKLLQKNGIVVVKTREPGGTSGGEEIRQLIFKLKEADLITPGEQMVLFFAARRLLIKEIIEPALRKGKVSLADRFYHSTGAYQSYGEGGDMEKVLSLIEVGLGGFKPDAVVLLDVSPRTAMERIIRDKEDDPFDRLNKDFFEKVVNGYREMANDNWGGHDWYVVDGEMEVSRVSSKVRNVLEDILETKLQE